MTRRARLFLAACSLLAVLPLTAADAPITISRTTGAITIDGDLSDPGWQNATRFDTWYETKVSDNGTPPVRQVGYVTYDDRFFYVAIKMDDPHPELIRGPYGDHDNISGNSDDFAGVLIDSRNDNKTAIELFVNPHNIQYDATQDDNSGEDSSPDYYWDSAAKVTKDGWQIEMRIPFSSLRYKPADVQTWGILLYRNYPRDRRYQIFTHRLPRDSSCFVCNYNKVTGLEGLPSAQHVVAAPYVTGRQETRPLDNFGDPLHYQRPSSEQGLDLKWTPNADTAIDATLNPDFSQIESDVAAISTNERFAIFYPERRPFFLEDVSIFSTPIQAVSTRTITAPRWGLRSTGKFGGNAYTLLVAQDRGGGLTIVPSALSSRFAPLDAPSTNVIGRVRHDIGGTSFISLVGTAREIEGGAHNRVIGPDFTWRPNDLYTITGQLLLSDTTTPNRPDIDPEWDGRTMRSHAGDLRFQRVDAKNDLFLEYLDLGDGFRADSGFLPQVGYRSGYIEYGRTYRPTGFFNRIRVFGMGQYQTETNGWQLNRLRSFGFGADGSHRSFWRFRFANENVRTPTNRLFTRNQLLYVVQVGVNRVLSFVSLDGYVGQDVDFDNDRLGHGANVNLGGTLRPTDHLELRLTNGVRWLNVPGGHLFTSQIERVKGTYTFDARRFVRVVVQNRRDNFKQALWLDHDLVPLVPQHQGGLASQVLFAYKVNWQTVMYIGAGDLRDVDPERGEFAKSARSVFVKLSYAIQR